MSSYPDALARLSTRHRAPTDPVIAEALNDHAAELLALEAELGLNPAGGEATVAARLDTLEGAAAGAEPIASALTDLILDTGVQRSVTFAGGAVVANYYVAYSGTGLVSTANDGASFYLDPADMPAITGKTKKLRLDVLPLVNTVDVGVTMTFDLLPVTGLNGAANNLLGVTVGASVGQVAFAAADLVAQSRTPKTTTIDHPAAGVYIWRAVPGGTLAANTRAAFNPRLKRLWV